jgi:translocation and assembly module TamB
MKSRALGLVKWMALTLVLLVGVALSITYWVLATERGFKTAIEIAEKCISGFTVVQTRGDLFDGVEIVDLRFDSQNLSIHLKQAETQIQWQSLLSFVIPSLRVEGLSVRSAGQSESPPPPSSEETLSRIHLPIDIQVQDIRLDELTIDASGNQFSMEKLTAGLQFSGSLLTLSPAVVSGVILRLAEKAEPPKQPANHPTQFPHQVDPIQISLKTIVSPVDIMVEQLDVLNLFIPQQAFDVEHLLMKAKVVKSELSLQTLDAKTNKGDLEVTGSASLVDDYPLDVHLKIDALTKLGKNQHIAFNATGSLADLTLTGQLSGLSEADFTAKCQVLKENVPFSLRLVSRYFQWPLVDEPQVMLEENLLLLKGTLANYQLNYHGKLNGSNVPETAMLLKAAGNLGNAKIETLQLDVLDGNITAKGDVSWLDGLIAKLAVELSHINPEKQWPAFEGVIHGDLEATFEQTNEGERKLHLSPDIEGELNSSPLLAKGQEGFFQSDVTNPKHFALTDPNLELLHGENHIDVKGELSDKLTMSAQLSLPDLKQSLPDVGGSVQGHLELAGTTKKPVLTTDLNIEKFTLNDTVKLQTAKAKGVLSLSESVKSNFLLSAQGFSSGQLLLTEVVSRLDGSPSQHHLTVKADGDPIGWALDLTGGFSNSIWQGQINSSKGNLSHIPIILEKPFTLKLAKGELDVSQHCWRVSTSPLCLVRSATIARSGQLAMMLKALPIDDLSKELLPMDMRLSAKLNANVDVSWQENKLPTIKGQISIPQGGVSQQVQDGEVAIGWHKIDVRVDGDDGHYKSHARIDFTDDANFNANLAYEQKAEGGVIDGDIQLNRMNLKKLEGLIPFYQTFNGFLNGQVKIAGAVTTPKITGQVKVTDIVATGPEAPVQFKRGDATLTFNENKANLSVNLVNQGTPLRIAADAQWQGEKQWALNASVNSENIQVKKTPVSMMKVVPNIQFSATQLGAMLKGQIDVPEALIKVKKLPASAVTVSQDEVLVSKKKEDHKPITYPIDSQLLLNIGDKVMIDALGLQAHLTGKLFLKREPIKPSLKI